MHQNQMLQIHLFQLLFQLQHRAAMPNVIPEATIVSKDEDVAPCFLIKNSSSFDTSISVNTWTNKIKIC